MRALLIDPDTESVSEVDYTGDYKDIYRLIENNNSPYDVRPLHGRPGEVIFFDDEFLLKATEGEPRAFFYLNGVPDPIGGKALIVGSNDEGESVASTVSLIDIEANIRWKQLTLKGWTPCSSKKVVHPSLGPLTQIVGPRPIFSETGVASPDGRDVVDLVGDNEIYRKSTDATRQLTEFLNKFMEHSNGRSH